MSRRTSIKTDYIMPKKFIEGTELVRAGFANGISSQLAKKQESRRT